MTQRAKRWPYRIKGARDAALEQAQSITRKVELAQDEFSSPRGTNYALIELWLAQIGQAAATINAEMSGIMQEPPTNNNQNTMELKRWLQFARKALDAPEDAREALMDAIEAKLAEL